MLSLWFEFNVPTAYHELAMYSRKDYETLKFTALDSTSSCSWYVMENTI